MNRCHRCGQEWATEKRVKVPGVKETCLGCGAYLHCCLNCAFRDPSKHNQCAVPNTERIVDKEGANFCDDFRFTDGEAEGGGDAGENRARQALDNLFGGDDKPSSGGGADAFNKLFGD